MKITKAQLKQIIKEELETVLSENSAITREGIGDMFRQVGRDFVGKLKTAQEMSHLVNRLVNMQTDYMPGSKEFFGASEHLIGLLKAHGVDWMRPSAGGTRIVDADELKRVIDAYKDDPSGQFEAFDSAMRSLKNALDAYIRGEKL